MTGTGSGPHGAVLCFILSLFLITASARYVVDKRGSPGVPLLTFKLTRVTQEPENNGYRVHLYMSGSRLPEVYLIHGFRQPEQLQLLADGSVEFHQHDGDPYASLLLLHPQGYQQIQIRVNASSVSEQLLPDADIFLPAKEIVFDDGQDVDANVTFAVDVNEVVHFFTDHGFAMRSTMEENVVRRYDYNDNDALAFLGRDDTENGSLLRLRVTGHTEGLLELDLDLLLECQEEDSCLVNYYSIHEDVPVRRSDHAAGPFPEHFVGLMRREHKNTSEEYCSTHENFPCLLRCEVIGDHPSPVQLLPTDQDPGQLSAIGGLSLANGGFRALGAVMLDKGQLNGEAEYECRSRSGPVEFRHVFRVMVVHEARIHHGLTLVNVLDNGMVEVKCVASGTPAPTLTFYDRNDTALNDVSSDSYELVMMQPDETTSEGVLRIYDPAVANRLREVRCLAENEVKGHHFEESVRLHVAQENPLVDFYLQNHVLSA